MQLSQVNGRVRSENTGDLPEQGRELGLSEYTVILSVGFETPHRCSHRRLVGNTVPQTDQ